MSHELRTPTHAILGHAELLLGGMTGTLSPEVRASLSDIQKAGKTLLTQIDRLIGAAACLSDTDVSKVGDRSSAILDLLETTLTKAHPADDGLREHAEGQGLPIEWSNKWLPLLAGLLDDIGAAVQPGGGRYRHDTDHGIRFQCRGTPHLDPHDLENHRRMIEATMAMMGGMTKVGDNMLILAWPLRPPGRGLSTVREEARC